VAARRTRRDIELPSSRRVIGEIVEVFMSRVLVSLRGRDCLRDPKNSCRTAAVTGSRPNGYRMREHTDLWHGIQPKVDDNVAHHHDKLGKKPARIALRLVSDEQALLHVRNATICDFARIYGNK
jgi:hypothetical protein